MSVHNSTYDDCDPIGSSDQSTGCWRRRTQETAAARDLVQKEVRAELAKLKRLKAAGVASWNEVTGGGRKEQHHTVSQVVSGVYFCLADGFPAAIIIMHSIVRSLPFATIPLVVICFRPSCLNMNLKVLLCLV